MLAMSPGAVARYLKTARGIDVGDLLYATDEDIRSDVDAHLWDDEEPWGVDQNIPAETLRGDAISGHTVLTERGIDVGDLVYAADEDLRSDDDADPWDDRDPWGVDPDALYCFDDPWDAENIDAATPRGDAIFEGPRTFETTFGARQSHFCRATIAQVAWRADTCIGAQFAWRAAPI